MRPVTRIALALVAVTLAGACSTSPRGTRLVDGLHELSRRVLSNGATVVVQEFPSSEVVALQLWIRAGSRDESARELGLAHYLEHLVFKGTESRRGTAMVEAIERIGGKVNAATSLDYTFFHVTVPARAVTAGIDLLADLGVNARLDDAALEDEKRVVLEEMRRDEDEVGRFLGRRLYALAFDGHPYARPVIGDDHVVRGLGRDALVGFYRRHYVPESFVLVVVGPVHRREVVDAAERTLGQISGRRPQRPPVATLPPLVPGRTTVVRPGTHAYVGVAWHAPGVGHHDAPAMSMLASILTRGPSSRLTKHLREDLRLATAVSGSYSDLEAGGVFSITARVEARSVEAVEAALIAEIRRVRDGGVSEAERRRAVTAAEAAREVAAETVDGRAYRLGRAETLARLAHESTAFDRLRSADRERLRATARRYLDPDRYVRIAVLPSPPAGERTP